MLLLLLSISNSIYTDLIQIGDAELNITFSDNIIYNDIFKDQLKDLRDQDGGILNIGEGTYLLDTNIIVYDKIHVKGAGMNKTILKLIDYAPPFFDRYWKSGLIRARFVDHIIISDLTLDGNRENQYQDHNHSYGKFGLFTEACDHVWFDNVKVMNFQGYGFDPHGKKPDNWGHYLSITNCISENNHWDGFALDQTYNIHVENSKAINNGRHGFNIITGSQSVNLINNTAIYNGFHGIYNGTGCGIMVQNNDEFGTQDVFLENNYISESYKAGICLNGVEDIYVKNNIIEKSCNCIELIETKDSFIIKNQCRADTLYRKIDNQDIVYNNNKNKHWSCSKGFKNIPSFLPVLLISLVFRHLKF